MRAKEYMPDNATDVMCEKLQRMQTVKTFDFDRMYRESYSGINVFNVNKNVSQVRYVHGCNLAMRLRADQAWQVAWVSEDEK